MTAMDFAKAGKHKDVCAVLATLGVTAQRDVGRLLARRLKREFEGSLVEHSDGFLLNAKLAGHRCQFRVDSKDAAAAVFGLKYIAPEFLGKKLPSLTLGHGKPKVPGDENRVRISPSATAAAGMDVYSSLKPKDELEDSLITFCSRLKSEFQKLALQPGEHLHFSDNFAAFVWRDFEPEQTITRLQLFADLLAKLVRAPQPERRLFELEWLIKPALKTAIQTAAPCHRFGGAPDMEICCPHCSAPTDPIIQIDLGDPQLPSCILEHSPLPVHWCLECGEWDATFLPLPHKSTHRLKPSCEPFDAQGPSDDKQKLPVRRMKLIPVASGKKAGRKSKIGGSPSWIQQDETPDCKSCLQPMSFALQMTSDRSISYGDVGVLYAFVCLDCRHVATVVQSH
jgi:hypothetical protein